MDEGEDRIGDEDCDEDGDWMKMRILSRIRMRERMAL